MNKKEFNEKYKAFLEEGFYGLDIENEGVIKYLDTKFQEFIKRPDFKYSQIKSKFNTFRFYSEGVTFEEQQEIEKNIFKIYHGE